MGIVDRHLYEFGPYQVDPDRRVLLRDNQPIPLQPKAFETLLVLIRNRQHVVLKDDLMKSVWPDSFVEESNLSQNIFVLRKALGAAGGRYIVTIPGRGYRFAEAVKEIPAGDGDLVVESHSTQKVTIEEIATQLASPGPESLVAKLSRTPWKWIFAVAVIVVVLAGALLWVRSVRAHPVMNEADLVLVSDFVNTTGEPIFDGSLKQALSVKLAESPYFDVALDSKTRQTLRLMGRSPDERVVNPVSREVCQREGAKVAIDGSIVRPGNKYVVDLNAINCLTGASVAHQEIAAPNRDEVLRKLGEVIPPLRRKLGESVSSIQKFDTPIEQATTKSLAALKAYTEGDEARARGDEEKSIPFYKMAIELDPDFAVAHARLGAVYANLQQPVLSEEYKRKAFEHREHIGEREKLYVEAHYYGVTGEADKGVQIYELWSQIYPHDWIPFNNLANDLANLGDPDKAIRAGQQALRLNPDHEFPYGVLAQSYMTGSHFAEAKAVCEKAAAAKFDRADCHALLMEIALIEGDEKSVQKERKWSEENPVETAVLFTDAVNEMSLGRVRAAEKLFQRARVRTSNNKFREFLAYFDTREASFDAYLGHTREARSLAEEAFRISTGYEGETARTLARIGDSRRAEALADELSRKRPADLLIQNVVLPCIRAAEQMNRNNPSAAVAELQKAIPYDLSALSAGETNYLRGYAFLQTKAGKDAAQQFQKILDNRGEDVFFWPLAHLGLARAYAATGDIDKSLAAYQEFLQLWKDADPDVPIFKDAKGEYAKLSTSAFERR